MSSTTPATAVTQRTVTNGSHKLNSSASGGPMGTSPSGEHVSGSLLRTMSPTSNAFASTSVSAKSYSCPMTHMTAIMSRPSVRTGSIVGAQTFPDPMDFALCSMSLSSGVATRGVRGVFTACVGGLSGGMDTSVASSVWCHLPVTGMTNSVPNSSATVGSVPAKGSDDVVSLIAASPALSAVPNNTSQGSNCMKMSPTTLDCREETVLYASKEAYCGAMSTLVKGVHIGKDKIAAHATVRIIESLATWCTACEHDLKVTPLATDMCEAPGWGPDSTNQEETMTLEQSIQRTDVYTDEQSEVSKGSPCTLSASCGMLELGTLSGRYAHDVSDHSSKSVCCSGTENIRSSDGHRVIVEPGEGEESSTTTVYSDAAFVGSGRDSDFPELAERNGCSARCGASDDKSVVALVSHVTVVAKVVGALSKCRACSPSGGDEEAGRLRTEWHKKMEESFMTVPMLDGRHLSANLETGTRQICPYKVCSGLLACTDRGIVLNAAFGEVVVESSPFVAFREALEGPIVEPYGGCTATYGPGGYVVYNELVKNVSQRSSQASNEQFSFLEDHVDALVSVASSGHDSYGEGPGSDAKDELGCSMSLFDTSKRDDIGTMSMTDMCYFPLTMSDMSSKKQNDAPLVSGHMQLAAKVDVSYPTLKELESALISSDAHEMYTGYYVELSLTGGGIHVCVPENVAVPGSDLEGVELERYTLNELAVSKDTCPNMAAPVDVTCCSVGKQ